MARVSLFILLSLTFSCINKPKVIEQNRQQTITEQGINKLEKNYREELTKANSEFATDVIKEDYKNKLSAFLKDSIKGNVQGLDVKIERIESIMTGLYHIIFMNPKAKINYVVSTDTCKAPLLNLLKNLKEGVDTTMSFYYIGSVKVNNPDSYDKPFEFDASPILK